MADSVAPKERINVVYEHKTGGLSANKELPLKLAIIGDFTLRNDARSIEQRPPVSINKSSYNGVMTAHELSLDLTIYEEPSRAKSDDKEQASGKGPEVQRPVQEH